MWRNRNFRKMVILMSFISLIGMIIATFYSFEIFVLILIISIALVGSAILYTTNRYRDIETLSSYLRQISAGDYTLDVRDNYEGELSILKSNIYKVTSMLASQSNLLQEDKKDLTDAISDISHQLKTPLTSMMVMADLLDDTNLPTNKRKEFTYNIHTQLERIEWLVSSLLKLSKIDAGSVVFKEDPIDMSQLINKVIEHFLIQMDVKEQTILLSDEQSFNFKVDFNWTVEALVNIMKNCIEHTQSGGEIKVFTAENILFTEIIIADNGPGIAKEDIPFLFKRFYKGKNASIESVGIGLALAQQIITKQNGDIEVLSEVGKGTEFRVKFYKK